MNLDDLKKPFPPDRISWRVGSTTQDKTKGMALAYIDARDVQDRLDEVCGGDWQCRYPHANTKTVCEIGIKIDGEWVWRADGAGDSDIEAEKGALSDAFKRAAVRWGVGRYLYDLDSPWVALENKRIVKSEYARLRALLAGNAKPATPQPAEKHKMTPAEWAQKASDEIQTLRTDAELSAWLQKNNAAIEKLRDTDSGLYNATNTKIANRSDELRRIAA